MNIEMAPAIFWGLCIAWAIAFVLAASWFLVGFFRKRPQATERLQMRVSITRGRGGKYWPQLRMYSRSCKEWQYFASGPGAATKQVAEAWIQNAQRPFEYKGTTYLSPDRAPAPLD